MTKLFQSLLLVIASATQAQLARQIQYLKIENEILRSKLPARITVTPAERQRLLRYAFKLGRMIRHLVSIVTPGTMLRWIREAKRDRGKRPPVKRGRRRKPEQIRRLVLKLARENDWGYTRILGELKKLGIRTISKNTVKRILKENGFDPGPKRGAGTWDEFLKRHAASLWQCDFLTQRIITLKGIRDAFVLVFVHVKTRQVVISPATLHPNEPWVVQQADDFVADVSLTSVWSHFGAMVAELSFDRPVLIAPRIWQTDGRASLADLPRTPLRRSLSYPACTPRLCAALQSRFSGVPEHGRSTLVLWQRR